MAEMNDIVRVAVDAYHGNVQKYSNTESMQLLREALVAANNGSTKLDYRAIRDGKCSGLFTLIEEILSRTVVEGVQASDYWNAMVDFRNVPLGDKNLFVTEDSDLFVVAEAAEGTQGIRRQRLVGRSEVSIPTSFKVVKIYEELNRVLSGQVDFNYFIRKVSESFQRYLLDSLYSVWINATSDDFGGTTYFPAAGTYDEDTLLELVAHVEAAAGGKQATIIGTKVALRNLAPSIQGNDSKSDLYNLGFYGRFYSNPVVALPQRHKVGTTDFVYSDKIISIVAGDEKPIKVVREGQPTLITREATDNMDLTMEYLYGERWGTGIVLAGGNSGIGRYTLS